MAEEIEKDGPQETPAQHNKKANMVALVIMGILAIGLIFSSVASYFRSSDDRQDTAQEAEQGPRIVAGAAKTFADQEQLARDRIKSQLASDEQKRREEALLEQLRGQSASAGRQTGDSDRRADGGVRGGTEEQILAEYRLAELKRALESSRAPLRDQDGKDKGGVVKTAATPGSPELRELLAAKQRAEQQLRGIERRNQATQERIQRLRQGAGDAAPDPYANVPASRLPGQQIVGEAVSNRQRRQPNDSGPQPGELLLPTGSVISAVLDMTMISDYDGPWRALVERDVYDIAQEHILIPKGTRITGNTLRIGNVNEPIQARMGMPAKWAILPNGHRIDFSKQSALDHAGVAALKDQVNYHLLAQFLGVMAYAVLSSETDRTGTGISNDTSFEGQVGQSMREQFAPLAARYLNLVPTITLRPGTPIKIFVEDDMYLRPWAKLDDTLYTLAQ